MKKDKTSQLIIEADMELYSLEILYGANEYTQKIGNLLQKAYDSIGDK